MLLTDTLIWCLKNSGHHNFSILPLVESYYGSEIFEKANEICEKMIGLEKDRLELIITREELSNDAYKKSETEDAFFVLNEIIKISRRYEQTQITDKAQKVFNFYYDIYQDLQ